MALHCFRFSFSIYFGLVPIFVSLLFAHQWLILGFRSASISISSANLASLSLWISVFKHFLDSTVICSAIWNSLVVSSMFFFHMLVSVFVMSFTSDSSSIWSILLAWRIDFFFIVYSSGILPVSWRRIVVGVPFGRHKRVFIASLNILCSFFFSSLFSVQPSHAWVSMGIIIVSTICHIACIFIPLNSSFPVSAIMLAVAPLTFFSVSAMWSPRLPLLFMISPRYL